MSDHTNAVFNNSCLKLPRHRCSALPAPIFEQNCCSDRKSLMTTPNNYEKSSLKSLIDFYASIPEYDDVNHLPNKEFYRKIERLKETQKELCSSIENERKLRYKKYSWIEDYGKLNYKSRKDTERPTSCDFRFNTDDLTRKTHFRSTPTINTLLSPKSNENDTITSKDFDSKSIINKNVELINDFKNLTIDNDQLIHPQSAESKFSWENISNSDRIVKNPIIDSPTRNKPTVGWKENGITIPKPFQMTVRDEENKIVDEVFVDFKKQPKEKNEMFRAHPVPIESKIPLFDKIMTDQEIRSLITKEKRKQALKAKMRPFSFTRREEEMQAIAKRLYSSTPSLFLDEEPMKIAKFKAKPVPKGLFSNYAYQKMYEDEFYRALQRKIRAEEMMKASSLPPSMAKREKIKPKTEICPKSFLYLEDQSSDSTKRYLDRELENLQNDFLTPRSYRQKRSKLCEKRLKKCYGIRRPLSSSYKSSSTDYLSSVNRSNLAAVLRIQSAKKKQEVEMMKRLVNAKLKEETRWREKVLRKKPAWQLLAYSNEEDLAMRLQLRRDEERLRNEQHRHRMELMYGRVNQMPMLFERQSQSKKIPVTREELMDQLHYEYGCKEYSPKLSISEITQEQSKEMEKNGSKNLEDELD